MENDSMQIVTKTLKMAILTSDKTDFMSKVITKDKEGHYIMIKGSIHQEDITVINLYIPNIKVRKYMNQTNGSIKRRNR